MRWNTGSSSSYTSSTQPSYQFFDLETVGESFEGEDVLDGESVELALVFL